MSELKNEVVECHSLRECIKIHEDKMNELADKAEKRKKELLEQLSADPELCALKDEFNEVGELHAKAISAFSEKNDALLTKFGGVK